MATVHGAADVTRSARGRLAIETMMAPTAALASSAGWHPVDRNTARVEVDVDGTPHEIEITVDDLGRPVSATMPRWGNPLGEPFGLYPFGAFFTGERRSGGVLMSERIEAGWFAWTERWKDGVFFRAAIDEVLHR